MDLRLTEEQSLIQKTARDFAHDKVLPHARELDASGDWPTALVREMGELGFMGIAVPEQYGGGGADYVSYALAMIEISKACASTGVIMSVNNSLVPDPIYKFGNPAQKKEFLAPLASGATTPAVATNTARARNERNMRASTPRPRRRHRECC